jgi:cobaltochelatase CobT
MTWAKPLPYLPPYLHEGPMSATPIDNFKRVLSASTKAISGEPELEVSFGGDVAGIVRDQVMLPALPPKPKAELIAKARAKPMR